jgi:hypothetical protein
MTEALVDNDILLKTCRYGVDRDFVDFLIEGHFVPSILPVARFVVGARLRRDCPGTEADGPLAAFDRAMAALVITEPSDRELAMAAAFEAEAQRRNLELDVGESQLLAVLIIRGVRLMLTGDKRAIRAIEILAGNEVPGRLACLEQLVTALAGRVGLDAVRARVCREPAVDRTLTNCFACYSPSIDPGVFAAGIGSYLADIRCVAPRVLLGSDDLSALVA